MKPTLTMLPYSNESDCDELVVEVERQTRSVGRRTLVMDEHEHAGQGNANETRT